MKLSRDMFLFISIACLALWVGLLDSFSFENEFRDRISAGLDRNNEIKVTLYGRIFCAQEGNNSTSNVRSKRSITLDELYSAHGYSSFVRNDFSSKENAEFSRSDDNNRRVEVPVLKSPPKQAASSRSNRVGGRRNGEVYEDDDHHYRDQYKGKGDQYGYQQEEGPYHKPYGYDHSEEEEHMYNSNEYSEHGKGPSWTKPAAKRPMPDWSDEKRPAKESKEWMEDEDKDVWMKPKNKPKQKSKRPNAPWSTEEKQNSHEEERWPENSPKSSKRPKTPPKSWEEDSSSMKSPSKPSKRPTNSWEDSMEAPSPPSLKPSKRPTNSWEDDSSRKKLPSKPSKRPTNSWEEDSTSMKSPSKPSKRPTNSWEDDSTSMKSPSIVSKDKISSSNSKKGGKMPSISSSQWESMKEKRPSHVSPPSTSPTSEENMSPQEMATATGGIWIPRKPNHVETTQQQHAEKSQEQVSSAVSESSPPESDTLSHTTDSELDELKRSRGRPNGWDIDHFVASGAGLTRAEPQTGADSNTKNTKGGAPKFAEPINKATRRMRRGIFLINSSKNVHTKKTPEIEVFPARNATITIYQSERIGELVVNEPIGYVRTDEEGYFRIEVTFKGSWSFFTKPFFTVTHTCKKSDEELGKNCKYVSYMPMFEGSDKRQSKSVVLVMHQERILTSKRCQANDPDFESE